MHENQRQTIENLERELERDPNKQALILYGSVARGTAGKESDIDLYLVISDDDFDSVLRTGQLTVSFNQMCVEPCTEATGTFIALKNLHEIAQNGKDISRYAFVDSQIIFSKINKLDSIINNITTYPQKDKLSRLESFLSQVKMHHSYLEYGEYSGNLFVLHQTAVNIVLLGGRMILALNNMFYPGRKWFLSQLEKAPKKPENFLENVTNLLKVPSIENSSRLCKSLFEYYEWPTPKQG